MERMSSGSFLLVSHMVTATKLFIVRINNTKINQLGQMMNSKFLVLYSIFYFFSVKCMYIGYYLAQQFNPFSKNHQQFLKIEMKHIQNVYYTFIWLTNLTIISIFVLPIFRNDDDIETINQIVYGVGDNLTDVRRLPIDCFIPMNYSVTPR